MNMQLIDKSWVDSPINLILTTFEMPLFVVVSGYCLFFSLNKHRPFEVLKKRAVMTLPPIVILSFVPSVIRLFVSGGWKGKNFLDILVLFYNYTFDGKLWFLSLYLVCSMAIILLYVILHHISNKYLKWCLLILFVLICVVLVVYDNLLSHFGFFFPFFLVGYLLNKFNFFQRKIVCTYILAALYIPLLFFYRAEYSFYLLNIMNASFNVPVIIIVAYRFLLSLAGCSFIYVILSLIFKIKILNCIKKPFLYIGKRTMAIYILSMYLQDYLSKGFSLLGVGNYLSNYLVVVAFSIVFFIILLSFCVLFEYLIGKVKILHKLLFGS